MAQYRVHKSNMPQQLPSGEGFSFVRVSSNPNGVTLDRIAFADLPIVRHNESGQLGRRATVIENIEIDPDDSDYFVCTTKDVVFPHDEKNLQVGPESPWTDVGTAAPQRPKPGAIPVPTVPIHADRPPLRVDEGGVVRVGKSRVSLDVVVEQYENGFAPEDMVRAYDTLVLADVHAAVAYYLRHRDEVRVYLTRRAEEAESLRTKIETERPRLAPEELLARRGALEKDHAPTGQ